MTSDSTATVRAVALTALMVVSVVAGSLAGVAAAQTASVTPTNEPVTAGEMLSFQVTDDAGDSADTNQVWLDTNGNATFDPGEPNVSVNASAPGSVDSATLVVPANLASGNYTLAAVEAASLNGSETPDATALVRVITLGGADAVLDSGGIFWRGQSLFFAGAPANSSQIFSVHQVADDGSVGTLVTEIPLDDNAEAVIDTNELDRGQYVLVNQNGNPVDVQDGVFSGVDAISNAEQHAFNVIPQDFNATLDGDTALNGGAGEDTNVSLGFQSNRATFAVNVTWDTDAEVSPSTLADAFSSYDAEVVDGETEALRLPNVRKGDERPVDFTGVPTGTYNFTFEVVDTGVSATDSVEVQEAGVGDISFGQSINRVARGGVARVTLDMQNADRGTVVIGGSGVNYLLEATVVDGDDDGQVTLLYNTYRTSSAFDQNQTLTTADADDEVRNVRVPMPVATPIAPGDYNMNVSLEGGAETDVATLIVDQPSIGNGRPWVAPRSVQASADLPVLLGGVTARDSVARGDWAVAQFNASGLEGYFDASNLDGGPGSNGLSVSFTETDPGPNRDPITFDASADNVTVRPALGNNTFFVLWNTRNVPLGVRSGEYNVTFAVNADRNNVTETNRSTTVRFDVNPADVTLNDGQPVEVPSANATVSGQSNLAPGTELTVRARSTGNNPFLKTRTVTVSPGGEFNASMDFSDVPNGTEFTLQVAGFDASAIDGTVLEGAAVTTPTNTTTTTTTTTMTTTTTTTTTTPANQTTTTTPADQTTTTTTTTPGQPGFGVAVAAVALLAAALLALRRRR